MKEVDPDHFQIFSTSDILRNSKCLLRIVLHATKLTLDYTVKCQLPLTAGEITFEPWYKAGKLTCLQGPGRLHKFLKQAGVTLSRTVWVWGNWRVSAYPKAFTCKCFINTVLSKQKSSGAGFGPGVTSMQPLRKERENWCWNFRHQSQI